MDVDIKGKYNGLEVAEQINHLEIPTLFITSFDNEDFLNRAQKTNYIEYLVKPINKFTLKNAINSAMEKLKKKYQKQ